jgi:hypothetical protein
MNARLETSAGVSVTSLLLMSSSIATRSATGAPDAYVIVSGAIAGHSRENRHGPRERLAGGCNQTNSGVRLVRQRAKVHHATQVAITQNGVAIRYERFFEVVVIVDGGFTGYVDRRRRAVSGRDG